MKYKYEFEIPTSENNKILCEGCPQLRYEQDFYECLLSEECQTHYYNQPESHRIAALAEISLKCPVEVVK